MCNYREDEEEREENLVGITPYLSPVVSSELQYLEILIISRCP
jgi:hypothetical protein